MRLDLFYALKKFADARGITVAAAAEAIVCAGLSRKAQDVRRNEARQAGRS